MNPLPNLEGVVAGEPVCQPGEWGDGCAGVDADEGESMGRVHRTVDVGDGHQNQCVEVLEPENMGS